jgi:hypothetical protein
VARFEWFRKGERPAGAWLVRQGPLRFALPFTTGPHSGVADYLPAPHALPGFAVPVEQYAPALVPHLELADGKVIVASDCADELEPRPDGRGLRARWRRFAVVGGDPGPLVEPGLTSEVTFALEGGGEGGGDTLVRSETITATRAVSLRRFAVVFPSTGGEVATRFEDGRRIDRFVGPESALEVGISDTNLPLAITVQATGNAPAGRGARGHIPLILRAEAGAVALKPGDHLRWTIRLRALPPAARR